MRKSVKYPQAFKNREFLGHDSPDGALQNSSSPPPAPSRPRTRLDVRRRRRTASTILAYTVFPDSWRQSFVNYRFGKALAAGLDGRDDRGEKLIVHSLRRYSNTRLIRSGTDVATVLFVESRQHAPPLHIGGDVDAHKAQNRRRDIQQTEAVGARASPDRPII